MNAANLNEELTKILKALKAYQPQRIILFGSAARGDYHDGSDIDLLIIKNTDRRFVERIGDVLELLDNRLPVEPIVYTATEFDQLIDDQNSFVQSIIREGKVLYEQ